MSPLSYSARGPTRMSPSRGKSSAGDEVREADRLGQRDASLEAVRADAVEPEEDVPGEARRELVDLRPVRHEVLEDVASAGEEEALVRADLRRLDPRVPVDELLREKRLLAFQLRQEKRCRSVADDSRDQRAADRVVPRRRSAFAGRQHHAE